MRFGKQLSLLAACLLVLPCQLQAKSEPPTLDQTEQFLKDMIHSEGQLEASGFRLAPELDIFGPEIHFAIVQWASAGGEIRQRLKINGEFIDRDSIKVTRSPVGFKYDTNYRALAVSFECIRKVCVVADWGTEFPRFSFLLANPEAANRFSRALRHWAGFYQEGESKAPAIPDETLFK